MTIYNTSYRILIRDFVFSYSQHLFSVCEIIMNNNTCEIIDTCVIIMNNHTCEINDFISSGDINKTLIYIINFFKKIELIPLPVNLLHNLG